jgi:MFS family permease
VTDQARADEATPALDGKIDGAIAEAAPTTEAPVGEAPARRPRWGVLWTHADFMKFWAGETISLFGTQVTTLALPLTAIIVLHATPGQLGVLRFLQAVPFLLLALLIGAWVDRRRKRPVMIGSNAARCVLVGLVPILAIAGALVMPILYVLAFCIGVATVFFDVCWMAYVPVLVGKDQLAEGSSKVSTSYAAADVSGPALGGVLVQLLSAPKALAADALSYLVSIGTLLAIKTEEPVPGGQPSHPLAEIKEGLRPVFSNRYVRATTTRAG